MAYNLSPNAAEDFRLDLELIVNTRWLFVFGMVDINYVQIVNVSPGPPGYTDAENRSRLHPTLENWPFAHAHVVALYGSLFQHWWIPITNVLAEYGAFEWIGKEEDVMWIRPQEWIIPDAPAHPDDDPYHGAWCIDYIDGNFLHLRDRAGLTYPDWRLPISSVAQEWRRADTNEVEIAQSLQSAPVALPASPPSRSVWERIDQEDPI